MVHSFPVAGGSHQRALIATLLSHGLIDRCRGRDEGNSKGEIMKKWQTEVEKVQVSNENMGQKMAQSVVTRRKEDAFNKLIIIK